MNEHEQLLDEARDFCEPKTGEVLQRIPKDLMDKLRAAKLARGVPGRRSDRTETHATWFVFLSDDIRVQILAEWREANRHRRQRRTAATESKPVLEAAAASQTKDSSKPGLQQFRQSRKSVK